MLSIFFHVVIFVGAVRRFYGLKSNIQASLERLIVWIHAIIYPRLKIVLIVEINFRIQSLVMRNGN